METLGTDRHEELLSEWRSARPQYKPFCEDGILVEHEWKMASPKIAFLLKESNDDFVHIRGHRHGPRGNSRLFWRNLRIWRYVIACHFSGLQPTFAQAKLEKELPLADVAYINIKKHCQHRSVSDNRDIQSYIMADWTFLERQIQIIAPEVLVCCGTFRYIRRERLRPAHIAGSSTLTVVVSSSISHIRAH
jgi:hypothetical protein